MLSRALPASFLLFFLTFPALPQAAPKGPLEITSLLGRKLYALPDSDSAIAAAQKSLAASPKNVDLVLKLSKAQAAKRQYREAITTCTTALRFAPHNADLYLERGHRELGLREFKAALADLDRAVEIDPGKLEAQYHLGLAHYFLREFPKAAESFRRALDLAKDNDNTIDCSNWAYVSLSRAGQNAEAAAVLSKIKPDMKNKGPHLYFYLRLLHYYQGSISESDALPHKPSDPNDTESELSFNTVSYGVGNHHLYTHTTPAKAQELFQNVVTGNAWNSWGFVGSELELSRPTR